MAELDGYAEALARYQLADVQPFCRRMLLRLKERDRAAYEEAVSRYREQVEQEAAEAEEPLAVWIDYGAWLAARVSPGSLKVIDANGKASDAGDPPPLGPMLMHLPDDAKSRALVLAMPSAPSVAQEETASLLCG